MEQSELVPSCSHQYKTTVSLNPLSAVRKLFSRKANGYNFPTAHARRRGISHGSNSAARLPGVQQPDRVIRRRRLQQELRRGVRRLSAAVGRTDLLPPLQRLRLCLGARVQRLARRGFPQPYI